MIWGHIPEEPHFNYKGFNIPLRLAHRTGGADDTFDRISKVHMDLANRFVGLRSDMSIVEIGCGIGRDAIPLSEILSKDGRYLGIEVIKDMVDWCQSAITSRFSNFQFYHFDVKEKWYNPDGKMDLQECSIPVQDGSVDFIILHSVFTHMLAEDIKHYMREFSRILKKDGRVLATFFIVDDEILSSQGQKSYITFNHNVAPGCYVHDIENPTQAVSYTEEAIQSLVHESGLEIALPPAYGMWSGKRQQPISGQDVIILRKDDCGD